MSVMNIRKELSFGYLTHTHSTHGALRLKLHNHEGRGYLLQKIDKRCKIFAADWRRRCR